MRGDHEINNSRAREQAATYLYGPKGTPARFAAAVSSIHLETSDAWSGIMWATDAAFLQFRAAANVINVRAQTSLDDAAATAFAAINTATERARGRLALGNVRMRARALIIEDHRLYGA